MKPTGTILTHALCPCSTLRCLRLLCDRYLEKGVRDKVLGGEEGTLYVMCYGRKFPVTLLERPPVALTAKAPAKAPAS